MQRIERDTVNAHLLTYFILEYLLRPLPFHGVSYSHNTDSIYPLPSALAVARRTIIQTNSKKNDARAWSLVHRMSGQGKTLQHPLTLSHAHSVAFPANEPSVSL